MALSAPPMNSIFKTLQDPLLEWIKNANTINISDYERKIVMDIHTHFKNNNNPYIVSSVAGVDHSFICFLLPFILGVKRCLIITSKDNIKQFTVDFKGTVDNREESMLIKKKLIDKDLDYNVHTVLFPDDTKSWTHAESFDVTFADGSLFNWKTKKSMCYLYELKYEKYSLVIVYQVEGTAIHPCYRISDADAMHNIFLVIFNV